jgi:hypothetical protein
LGFVVVVNDESLFIDSVGVKVFEGTGLFSVGVVGDCCRGFADEYDDIPIEPIDTPLLVVISSN